LSPWGEEFIALLSLSVGRVLALRCVLERDELRTVRKIRRKPDPPDEARVREQS
jgi:hypothetical protein